MHQTQWSAERPLAPPVSLTSQSHHEKPPEALSCVQLFVTPCTAARQASLSFTISWSLLKLMSTESVMPSNHLVLCHPLFLLPSIFPSTGLCSTRCLSEPVPNFSIYSGHFTSHFSHLQLSSLYGVFDGQKLVILIN